MNARCGERPVKLVWCPALLSAGVVRMAWAGLEAENLEDLCVTVGRPFRSLSCCFVFIFGVDLML